MVEVTVIVILTVDGFTQVHPIDMSPTSGGGQGHGHGRGRGHGDDGNGAHKAPGSVASSSASSNASTTVHKVPIALILCSCARPCWDA